MKRRRKENWWRFSCQHVLTTIAQKNNFRSNSLFFNRKESIFFFFFLRFLFPFSWVISLRARRAFVSLLGNISVSLPDWLAAFDERFCLEIASSNLTKRNGFLGKWYLLTEHDRSKGKYIWKFIFEAYCLAAEKSILIRINLNGAIKYHRNFRLVEKQLIATIWETSSVFDFLNLRQSDCTGPIFKFSGALNSLR